MEMVIRFSCKPFIVTDRYLLDVSAIKKYKRWKKPVHPFEKFQILDALALERAISAARVGNLLARQFVSHRIGNAR